MSKILTKSNNYLSVFEDYLIKISGISLFVVMILTSFQIISRVLGYPWPGYLELSELSISIFAFLGVAYAQRVDTHIRMELIVGNLLWHVVNPRHDLNINKYNPWRFYAYFIKKYFINKEKIHKGWFYNRITSDEHYIESGSFTEEPVMENLPDSIHKIILENNGNLFGLFQILGNREDPKIASFTHGPHTPHALHYSHQKLYPLKNMQISNWQYKYKITTYYFDTLIYNELKKYDITKEQILEVFNLNLKLRGLPVISKEMKETSDRIWFDSDSNKLSPKDKYDMEAEEAALKKIEDEKIVKEAVEAALKKIEDELVVCMENSYLAKPFLDQSRWNLNKFWDGMGEKYKKRLKSNKSEHFSLTIAGRMKI